MERINLFKTFDARSARCAASMFLKEFPVVKERVPEFNAKKIVGKKDYRFEDYRVKFGVTMFWEGHYAVYCAEK